MRDSETSPTSQHVRLDAKAEGKDKGNSKGLESLREYQVSETKIGLQVNRQS
jgi:hypothetical protein